jgi:hypothetical protein
MRRWARLIAAIATVVAAAGATAYVIYRAGPEPDPVSLVTERPSLPGSGWRLIDPIRSSDSRNCTHGRSADAAWSIGGEAFAQPAAFEEVCVYRREPVAWFVYRSQSLLKVGGNQWPNFESWSDSATVPKAIGVLKPAAEQWELGCGIGHPDGSCQVWVFRARYDAVLTVFEFHSIGDGIRFPTMRRFVESIDRDIASKLRSQ